MVEAGLAAKFLPPNLINELVRDVCTSVLNYTSHPKKNEREEVAKRITEKFPFLEDPIFDEECKPWVIYNVGFFAKLNKCVANHSNKMVNVLHIIFH